MTLLFRALGAFTKDPGPILSIQTTAHTILIPVLEDPASSSDLHGYQSCTWLAYIYAGRTFIHIKLNKLLKNVADDRTAINGSQMALAY